VRDLRATCETLDPEMREGLQGVWREGRRELVSWMEGGGRSQGVGEGEGEGRDEGVGDGGGSIGKGEGEEEEEEEKTLGDEEWEARFLEVGELVEMYLRSRGAEGREETGARNVEPASRKVLGERATEEKVMRFREGRGGPAEKKKMGRMEARDELGAGWDARYEEIKAMVELEKEAERGVWRG
jgi:hypothetical protein